MVILVVRKRRAAGEARRLLEQCRVTVPPTPVEMLARALSLELRYEPLDSDLSGFVIRPDGGTRGILGVNSSRALVRQRFTIAHEIGHLLLHAGQAVHVDRAVFARFRDQHSSDGSDPQEIEANIFAAELLMPEPLIENDLQQSTRPPDLLDDPFVSRLAKRYGVSTQAITYRLVNLGFIEGTP